VKTLTLLALIALILVLLLGLMQATAQYSPLSPVHPPGLEDCPRACIENITSVGYPTCNAWCVEMYELDLASELISPHIPRPPRPAPPIPPTLPAPQACDRLGWRRMADWMGLYPLWTDGAAYCVDK